jgi:hypothetical protein
MAQHQPLQGIDFSSLRIGLTTHVPSRLARPGTADGFRNGLARLILTGLATHPQLAAGNCCSLVRYSIVGSVINGFAYLVSAHFNRATAGGLSN